MERTTHSTVARRTVYATSDAVRLVRPVRGPDGWSGMRNGPSVRHVVDYALAAEDAVEAHERWLLEWAFDWMDTTDIETIGIDRTTSTDEVTYTVTIHALDGADPTTAIEELRGVVEGMDGAVERVHVRRQE